MIRTLFILVFIFSTTGLLAVPDETSGLLNTQQSTTPSLPWQFSYLSHAWFLVDTGLSIATTVQAAKTREDVRKLMPLLVADMPHNATKPSAPTSYFVHYNFGVSVSAGIVQFLAYYPFWILAKSDASNLNAKRPCSFFALTSTTFSFVSSTIGNRIGEIHWTSRTLHDLEYIDETLIREEGDPADVQLKETIRQASWARALSIASLTSYTAHAFTIIFFLQKQFRLRRQQLQINSPV